MRLLGLYEDDPLWLRSEFWIINQYTTKELVFVLDYPI